MNFRLKNFTMQKFNNDVNLSGNHNDKYIKWTAHRKNIMSFIKSAFHHNPDMKSIIIFGAGECNDLDLSYLTTAFDRVVLTDVDEKSISEGITRQQLDENAISRIEITQVEYTGLENMNFFNTFSSLADKISLEGKITLYIDDTIEHLKSSDIMNEYQCKFDFVLSCPIYTQLMITQAEVLLKILNEFKLYSNRDLNKIYRSVEKSMSSIISKYNDLLISMADSHGIIAVLTDIIEIPINNKLLTDVNNCFKNQSIDTALLDFYTVKNGLHYGKTGRDDLLMKINKINILWSMWPFDEYKEYLVYGVMGKKKT